MHRLPHFCNFYAQHYDTQHIVGTFMAHDKIFRCFSLLFFLDISVKYEIKLTRTANCNKCSSSKLHRAESFWKLSKSLTQSRIFPRFMEIKRLSIISQKSAIVSWNEADESSMKACWRHFIAIQYINPLQTKRRPLYLKTQSVPRCKHISSRL